MMHGMKRLSVPLCSMLLAPTGCGGDTGSSSSDGSSTGLATSAGSTTAATSTSTPTSSGDSGSGTATSGGSTTGDPFGGSSVCSRGLEWNMGNTESPFMNPGMACRTCHMQMASFVNGRILIGGTVYETGHEPDLCFGIDGIKYPTIVEITDANNVVTELEVNEGGNFLWDKAQHGVVSFPITARVVRGSDERVMLTPQMDGNCNDCHTEDGANGAPGRIVAP